jgi:hypothetical protein
VLEVEELIDHRSGDTVCKKETHRSCRARAITEREGVLKAGGEAVMGNGNAK